MFRTLVLAVVAFGAAVPLPGSAQTIPGGINLHNGYIEVNNRIIMHAAKDAPPLPRARIDFRNSLTRQQSEPSTLMGTTYINACCVVAGSLYQVVLFAAYHITIATVRPRLCNVRGIPFGFAVVTFTGNIVWNAKEHSWEPTITPHVNDGVCPKDG
jgi:hypothetical protein